MICRRFWLACAGAVLVLSGQTGGLPHAGQLLIAGPASTDPDFRETVILLLRYDRSGAVGLLLNQKTPVLVAEIFPSLNSPTAKALFVHKGGPLRMGINALLRRQTKVAGASLLFGDVYLISDEAVLKGVLMQSGPGPRLRVYVGLCGWTAGQLSGELRRGVWSLSAPTADVIFDDRPETVWPRLAAKLRR